ncbi:MTAP family purine nucleoside phosphorylase [Nonomuraea diastatica]|uniref:MTAP family purine nucleoside phosphorylase n=1 Tax=Nonomuraea diastatica TaxID=1848329 RepID=UPI001FE3D64C|nr:MTAP family purine nucleoside phosphorylase [Nonomuraea diastatica]
MTVNHGLVSHNATHDGLGGPVGSADLMNASLAIIGGTGLYHLLQNAEEVRPETPYGFPGAAIQVGELGGRRVAFLPRHGVDHTLLPAEIPFRANLWALHALGARQVVAVNAVGSLRTPLRRGDMVLVDQFVDRTWGRPDTFSGDGEVVYISAADPFCERMRRTAHGRLLDLQERVHADGTVVVIQGPRFSSRAESTWFSKQGWDLVNMTIYPEVVLARELQMCYVSLCYVTDHDACVGDSATEPVSHHAVAAEFGRGLDRIRHALKVLAPGLADDPSCGCRSAVSSATA